MNRFMTILISDLSEATFMPGLDKLINVRTLFDGVNGVAIYQVGNCIVDISSNQMNGVLRLASRLMFWAILPFLLFVHSKEKKKKGSTGFSR